MGHLLSPRRQELFNSSRTSLVAGKIEQDDNFSDDTTCSSTCSYLTYNSYDEPTKQKRRLSSLIRRWNSSFRRALRRRAQAARNHVPEKFFPFLDLLLKEPDRILSTTYALRICRICLLLSSAALIIGRNGMAFFLSATALLIFHEAKRISQCIFLDRWLMLSGSTMLTSVISFVALTLSVRQTRRDLSTHLWLGGYLLQKLWGFTLGYYMYRHVESLHFLEIHFTILEGQNLATNASGGVYSRHIRMTPSIIEIYHGAAKLARTNDYERRRFRFAVLSTSLNVHKEIDCRLLAPDRSLELGIAKVSIPQMRNVRMVNMFNILDENGNSQGQLSVEIEVRRQSTS